MSPDIVPVMLMCQWRNVPASEKGHSFNDHVIIQEEE